MKDGMSSFDVLAVTAELQKLVGGFVDKVYQEGDEIVLRVNVPGAGRQELYAKVGTWLCLRDVPKSEMPPPFAATLRRHLDNARIAAIAQRGFDRIVTVTFDRDRRLILELFGKGNVALVQGDTALAVFRRARFRDRTVAPKVPYEYPPATANPLVMNRDAFAAALVVAKRPLVKALARGMNLGGPYAEEVCLRAGVDKATKATDSGDEKLTLVYEALHDLARSVRENPNPQVVFEGGVPIDATPVPLRQHEGRNRRPFATYSEALAFFLDRTIREAAPGEDVAGKFRRRLEVQEASLHALRREGVNAAALAILMYEHYREFDDLIQKAREGSLEVGGQVLALDRKRRVARVAIGDITELDVYWTKSVEQNAQLLYERKKEAEGKGERVEAAIEETKREMARAAKKAARTAKRPKAKPTRKFWFEAYRWCLSSEGFLILGGRDARSNDAVVKKHLKDGDRFVHAGVHGAPSCVVKEGSKAGEATLREACAFALTWSKAWSAGLASGSAYWVLPEQVSKQAESGEYVPRGAWIIRGKRNYVHDIPVRAAVGDIEHEGRRKVMAGPVSAVTALSARYFVLDPGDEAKEAFARRAAAAFRVPVDDVSRVLPPGPVRVVERIGIEG